MTTFTIPNMKIDALIEQLPTRLQDGANHNEKREASRKQKRKTLWARA